MDNDLLNLLVSAEIVQWNALDYHSESNYVEVRKEDFDKLMAQVKLVREKGVL